MTTTSAGAGTTDTTTGLTASASTSGISQQTLPSAKLSREQKELLR